MEWVQCVDSEKLWQQEPGNEIAGVFAGAIFICLTNTVCMYLCIWDVCVWFIGEPVTVSIFSLFSFLSCPASEPPGMIINLIIKHLLPMAPALSLPCGPPGPHHKRGEGEWGGGERERKGGHTGGARGRGWREQNSKSKRGHHHIAGFFYTGERLFFCVAADSVWSYVIPEQRKKKGTIRHWGGTRRNHSKGSPHLLWHL